jgi:hypothetical protein
MDSNVFLESLMKSNTYLNKYIRNPRNKFKPFYNCFQAIL